MASRIPAIMAHGRNGPQRLGLLTALFVKFHKHATGHVLWKVGRKSITFGLTVLPYGPVVNLAPTFGLRTSHSSSILQSIATLCTVQGSVHRPRNQATFNGAGLLRCGYNRETGLSE